MKTAQEHFGHKRSSTTLELYAERITKREREVASTMDAFMWQVLGESEREEASLEAFRRAVHDRGPGEWPDWVRELIDAARSKL